MAPTGLKEGSKTSKMWLQMQVFRLLPIPNFPFTFGHSGCSAVPLGGAVQIVGQNVNSDFRVAKKAHDMQ